MTTFLFALLSLIYNTTMDDQAKMERLLRLLMLLCSGIKYSKSEILERTRISERTFYRYMNTIENAGFILDRGNNRYSLQTGDTSGTLGSLLHFSEEEAYILFQTLGVLKVPDSRKESLFRKLNSLYDFRALANARQKRTFENIITLTEAISQGQRVLLENYRSSNSATIRDRVVEPIEFTSGYYDINCIDTEDGKNKQFKIERIGCVTILNTNCKCEKGLNALFTDAFRISAPCPIAKVKAELNLRAYNLLVEEFPATTPYIKSIDEHIYVMEIPVASFDGIGRFILGLPGDIHVQEPNELINHLMAKIRSHSFCKSLFSEKISTTVGN